MADILICDGHGQIGILDMLYDRPTGCEAELYTYSTDGTGINIQRSNWLIQDALMGSLIPPGWVNKRKVTKALYDFWLQGTRLADDGVAEWNNRLAECLEPEELPTWSNNIIQIYSIGRWVQVNVAARGTLATSKLMLLQPPPNRPQDPPSRVRLADILQHRYFANRQLDVLWLACTD